MTTATELNAINELIDAGFIKKIISIETGVAEKRLRRILKVKFDEGELPLDHHLHPDAELNCRNVKAASTLVRTHRVAFEATVVMSIYYAIAGQSIYKSVDINALIQAYQAYQSTRLQWPNDKKDNELSISICWSFARSLREYKASFAQCHHCDNSYYYTVDQSLGGGCPCCAVSGRIKEIKEEDGIIDKTDDLESVHRIQSKVKVAMQVESETVPSRLVARKKTINNKRLLCPNSSI